MKEWILILVRFSKSLCSEKTLDLKVRMKISRRITGILHYYYYYYYYYHRGHKMISRAYSTRNVELSKENQIKIYYK
jgi:hypothetical protein